MKKFLAFFFLLTGIGIVGFQSVALPVTPGGLFSGGAGTTVDPYLVATASQLDSVRYFLSSSFKQTADIKLTAYTTGEGWIPIGDATTKFTGVYDGDGHKIEHLFINRTGVLTEHTGLFGYINGATIKNLGVVCNLKGNSYTGGLVGCSEKSTIQNCYTTGVVRGYNKTGGLVGFATIAPGTISNCYSTAIVSGNYYAAGLIGEAWDLTLSNCYSTGEVISSQAQVGGLAARNIRCTATDCFWDSLTSYRATSVLGTGKTTAEMKTQATFTNWDFTTAPVWKIDTANDGYPYLAWQSFSTKKYFVTTSGSDSNDGLSWGNAFLTVQKALDVVSFGDTVWVAAGTYLPVKEYGGTGSRYQAFSLVNGVAMFGGFTGTETSLSQRTAFGMGKANETILSGDLNGDDRFSGASWLNRSENTYHVFYLKNLTAFVLPSTILDGFSIVGGNGNGGGDCQYAGGMMNDGYGPTIRNCSVYYNYGGYGGAFSNNFLLNTKSIQPTFINCLIAHNSSNAGAGIWNRSLKPTLTNTTIAFNSASGVGGAIANYMGGASTLNNCIIWGNTGGVSSTGKQFYDGAVLNNCCYEDKTNYNSGTITATDCITTDPKFCAPNKIDFRLFDVSPCADAGNDALNSETTDIRGLGFGRKLNKTTGAIGTIDMGAYEYKSGTDSLYLPEIDVRGNYVSIADGDTIPSFTDFTDFDSVGVAGDSLVQTFTIYNTGTDTLQLNPPKSAQNSGAESIMWFRGGSVTLSGTHAADFEVTQQPAATVPPGDSTTFNVKFDPSASGLRTAAVSIANNDADENPYTFAIQGTGTVFAPEIDVRGNGISIADSDTLPSLTDWTDFDSVSVAIDSLEQTFTVHNTGSATLYFLPPDFAQTAGGQSVLGIPSAVTLSGDHAADFEVTQQPAPSVLPGDSTTFKIKFDPSDTGLRTAAVSVSNTDLDENPYTFAIQGTGIAPEIDVQGNGLSIANGDTLPSVADFTNFGATAVADSTIQQSFKIFNTGNVIMYLGNRNQRRTQLASPGKSDVVTISGDHAADFSVTTDADPVITPGDSSLFTIQFDPSAGGVRSAVVGIASNDADENPYSFKIQGTGIEPPTVTTAAVDSITVISAVGGGNITNNGGDSVTVRGVCWGLAANPTTDSSHTSDSTGTGEFSSSISGLAHGTTYHVRAYATNSAGTGYGADSTFTTKQIIITTAPADTLLRGGRQVTYTVSIANVLPAMRGFSAQVDFDANHFTAPQFNQGAFLNGVTHWDTDGSDGSFSVSCAILGSTPGATGDGVLFTVQLTTADSVTDDLVDPDSANLVLSNIALRDLENDDIICDSTAGAWIVIDTAPPTMDPLAEADSVWYRSQPVFQTYTFKDNYNLDSLSYKLNDDAWEGNGGIMVKTMSASNASLPGYAELAERKALHWFYLRASDDAGNQGGYDQSWSFCFYKDETAPDGELALSFAHVAPTSMDVVGAAFGDSTQGQVYYEFDCTTNGAFDRARTLADSIHECTGLTPNTQYSFKYQVSDGVNDPKATPAYNATEWSADSSKYTLSVAPTTTTVTCDKSGVIKTTTLTFTAVGGFGAGKVQYYRYILLDSVSHVWTGSETQWNSGTLQMGIPKANTNYYLHVKGYNAEDVANGTLALGPYQWDGTPIWPVTKLEMTAVVNSLELSWTNPKDDAHKIQVWLKGFGGYPKYTGSVPQFPENPTAASNNGWFLATNSLASSFKYSPNSRDYYYVAIFVEDLAQHYSAAALDSSLSYWLGDVNPTPDGAVNASDIAILASAFYTHPTNNDWNGICDVGPTLDYARISRPVPDSSINFEDLMIFAMNYENTGPVQLKKPAVIAEDNPITLELNLSQNNGRFLGRILLAGNASLVKALEISLVLGAEVQVLSVRKGSLVSDGDFFLSNQDGNTLSIATAALDESGVFDGNGILAEFDFQVSGANLELNFGTASARTAKNVAIEINYQTTDVALLAQSLIPTEYKLHQNFPNPFNPQTTIRYDLKENGPVKMTLYNINGQFVANLINEEKHAGYHSFTFEAGHLPSGVYIYKIQMNDFRDIRKLVLIK